MHRLAKVKKAKAEVTAALARMPAREEPSYDKDDPDREDYCEERKAVRKKEKAYDREMAKLAEAWEKKCSLDGA